MSSLLMKVTKLILIFLVVFSFTNITAQSNIFQEFSVAGCTINEVQIALNSCSKDGNYFCNNNLQAVSTSNGGCNLGSSSGQTQCCPAGKICNKQNGNCELRTKQCESFSDKSSCEANSCYFVDNACSDRPTDYSCNTYKTQLSCNDDIQNLGSTGIGTEICGSYFAVSTENFVIPQNSCKCGWNPTANQCELKYDVSKDIYSGTRDYFTCSKLIENGPCIDGSQTIEQTSRFLGIGSLSNPTTYILSGASCTSESYTRVCGKPIIKLPGFSKLSFALVMIILALFYATQVYKKKIYVLKTK